MMYNSDTEFLFPARVIPSLRGLRGEDWRGLVEQVSAQEPSSPDLAAFVLMMVRLGGCATCHSDSFRALNGCTQCARQAVRRFHGSDQELLARFGAARQEVERHLNGGAGASPGPTG